MGWEVVQKIENPNGVSDDDFGRSVSVSGNYAVVGAYKNDDASTNAGAAYFYQRDSDGHWNLVKKHTGEADSNAFGYSVSISGNYAVIGAPTHDSSKGAAYFYQRDSNGSWNLVKKHTGEISNVSFGWSVSVSGNHAVVGAAGNDDSGTDTGAAYFYQLDSDGHWNMVKKHIGEAAGNQFGWSVSVSGNYAVVGSNKHESDKGAAYFYQRDSDGHWNLLKKHKGESASDKFGHSVSISGNYAFVGAVDRIEEGSDTGAAYFYQCDNDGHWNLVNKQIGETGGDQFGYSISISGNYVIVGAPNHDGVGTDKGAAYFYQRDSDGHWNLLKKHSGNTNSDLFGFSVSISGNYAFSGASGASTEYVDFIQYKV